MAHIGEPIWPDVEYEPCIINGKHFGDFPVDYEAEMKWMDEQFNNEPSEGIKGCFLTFPVGDGKAIYKVVSLRPLTISLVMFGDRWQVDYFTIETLTKQRIEELVEGRRKIARIFSTSG